MPKSEDNILKYQNKSNSCFSQIKEKRATYLTIQNMRKNIHIWNLKLTSYVFPSNGGLSESTSQFHPQPYCSSYIKTHQVQQTQIRTKISPELSLLSFMVHILFIRRMINPLAISSRSSLSFCDDIIFFNEAFRDNSYKTLLCTQLDKSRKNLCNWENS